MRKARKKSKQEIEQLKRVIKSKLALKGLTQTDVANIIGCNKAAVTIAINKGYRNSKAGRWFADNIGVEL